jgi:hypothetical protein
MVPRFLLERFSNPSLVLVVFLLVPVFWPLLFFTWPVICFFIVSDKFLRNPLLIHTNKNLLRDMYLFKKCSASVRRGASSSVVSSGTSPPPVRRQDGPRNPLVIAHRGGGGEFPENTSEHNAPGNPPPLPAQPLTHCRTVAVAAAKSTLASTPGSTILHVDLHLTRDKEVICFHDQEPHERNMLKLTGRDASIRTFTYAELPPLSPRIPTNPLCDLGTYIDTTQFREDGRTICKFEDLCENFIDTPMILELWDDDPELVARTHDILFNYRKSRHVVWGNRFSREIQSTCEQHDLAMPTFNTASQWIIVYICYYLGLLPFVPLLHFDVFHAVLINEDRCAMPECQGGSEAGTRNRERAGMRSARARGARRNAACAGERNVRPPRRLYAQERGVRRSAVTCAPPGVFTRRNAACAGTRQHAPPPASLLLLPSPHPSLPFPSLPFPALPCPARAFASRRYRRLLLGAVPAKMRGVARLVFGAVCRTANYFLRAPGLFGHLSARGIPVVGFSINDTDEWAYACQHNFAAVVTDYPKKMVSFLRGNVQVLKVKDGRERF